MVRDIPAVERAVHRHHRDDLLASLFVFETGEGAMGMFRPVQWIENAPGMRMEMRLLRPADNR